MAFARGSTRVSGALRTGATSTNRDANTCKVLIAGNSTDSFASAKGTAAQRKNI
jgi:hypothetical protein